MAIGKKLRSCGGPIVWVGTECGSTEELKVNHKPLTILKKKKRDAFSQEGSGCSASPSEWTLFHCRNCGGSSKFFCSLPCTTKASLPFNWIQLSIQSSPSVLASGEKDFWVNRPAELLRGTMLATYAVRPRFRNKYKPIKSTWEENWWERESPSLKMQTENHRRDREKARTRREFSK